METEKELRKLEKSQLMFYFLISRDNLIRVKNMLDKHPRDEDLEYIYTCEEREYNAYLEEIYRRMK